MIKQSELIRIGKWVAGEIVKELEHQGHKSTGSLAKSIKPEIMTDGLSQILGISMHAYGVYVNTGVRGERVRTPIDVLVKWVEKKLGKRGKEARSIAFAIRAVQMKEGMPTKNSKRFSKNGRRVGFIDDAMDEIDAELFLRIQDAATKDVVQTVDRMVKDFRNF